MNHFTELNTPETVADPGGGRPMKDSVNARERLTAELEALRGRVVELESALSVSAVRTRCDRASATV